ncbi:MAG: ParB/RepB/Spo0J family partition protein [Pacificimonas sp.]|jgi:ParB family chromosome partitioning protein|nr:ParB/RepB/Spo0J family partition protein [Pacificimonas sp.]
MAKQKDYLADILGDDEGGSASAPETAAPASGKKRSAGPMTLLGRESALARVASGEVRQVTQLLLDPARVRVWPGNARRYNRLTEENTRDLIDSIIAEGGQKVPAIVRRVTGSASHDYEVIAGTRRHFAVSWLRAHSYPDTAFLAEVHDLGDEAAFRLADIENRARKDVSDLERARNYAAALTRHYDGHQGRMAERLRISQGWLSKMLKVAELPEPVIDAFASLDDIKLKPAYPLAQAAAEKGRAEAIMGAARTLAAEQRALRDAGRPALPAATVIQRLLAAGDSPGESSSAFEEFFFDSRHGRPALTVTSVNRQGVTVRLHAGSGATEAELARLLKDALAELKAQGRPLQK